MAHPRSSEEYTKEDSVLLVGLVCMDIVFTGSHYPVEDSIIRALEFVKRRGGNASNSCTVLSHLKTKGELLAPFGGDKNAKILKEDLQRHGISYKYSRTYPQCRTPLSNVMISQASGSRTGMHLRGDLPENSFEDFCEINLSNYSWIHFEGRCFTETQKMMAFVDAWNGNQCKKKLRYSVELEECEEEIKEFIPLANYIFVSKDFAHFMGYEDMQSTICGISSLAKEGAVIIVPWGDQGAMARCSNGEVVASKAYPPPRILDSVGAGDTFIAATISYLSRDKSVSEAIEFGCRVAGAKVGMTGFSGLSFMFSSHENTALNSSSC